MGGGRGAAPAAGHAGSLTLPPRPARPTPPPPPTRAGDQINTFAYRPAARVQFLPLCTVKLARLVGVAHEVGEDIVDERYSRADRVRSSRKLLSLGLDGRSRGMRSNGEWAADTVQS